MVVGWSMWPAVTTRLARLPGFERPDLVGDAENLGRSERDGLQGHVLGQAEGDGGGRLVRAGCAPRSPRRARRPCERMANGHAGGVQFRRVGVGRSRTGRSRAAAGRSVPPSMTGTFASLIASATFHASAPPEITALSFSSRASSRASRISTCCSAWKITGFSPRAYGTRASSRGSGAGGDIAALVSAFLTTSS